LNNEKNINNKQCSYSMEIERIFIGNALLIWKGLERIFVKNVKSVKIYY
jgi:hypothetical protein